MEVLITRNFIKASFIYTIAGALPLASAVILLPLYVYYLPTDVYGALSLYLAFSLFVQIVVIFSFDSSIYLHYHDFKNDPPKLASFISSAFVLMLLTGAAVGIILVVLGELAFDMIFHDARISFFPFGLMSVAIGIFQALFKVYNYILQSREKPGLFLRSNLLHFIFIAAFTLAGLYIFPGTLYGPVGGRMLAGVLVGVWALYQIFREFGIHFNFPLLRSTFGYNIYAFIYQLEQWGINYLDRFLLIFFMPLSAVGLYDIAIKCLLVLEFILNGMHNSFYPKVVSTITAQTEKSTTPELNRYYHGMIAMIMVLVSVSVFILPFVIDMLDSKHGYREAIKYLPFVAVLYILRAWRYYFATPLSILKYTKPLPVISAIAFAVKIGLMFLWIRQYEIYGVIISTLVSATVELVMLRYALRNRFIFRFNFFKIILAPLVLFSLVLILEPIFGTLYNWQLHLFYGIITTVFLLWAYRNELKLLNLTKFIK